MTTASKAWVQEFWKWAAVAIVSAAATFAFGSMRAVSIDAYQRDIDKINSRLDQVDKDTRDILSQLVVKTTKIETQLEDVKRRLDNGQAYRGFDAGASD